MELFHNYNPIVNLPPDSDFPCFSATEGGMGVKCIVQKGLQLVCNTLHSLIPGLQSQG